MTARRLLFVLTLVHSACLLSGCGFALKTTERIGMGASLVKSPVTLPVYYVNDRLLESEEEALRRAASTERPQAFPPNAAHAVDTFLLTVLPTSVFSDSRTK